MEYLPLIFAGLLGGAYILCSIAEILLSWFDRPSAVGGHSIRASASGRTGTGSTGLLVEASPPDPQAGTAQKPGILIADAHRLYRRILERWFRDHGFTVWATTDGQEAVALHRAHAKDIALALLDVPGLDGPETLAALRQECPSIPCCFMSAHLAAREEAQLLALGAAGVFEKPLLLRETTAVIWGLINQTSHSSHSFEQAPGEP